MAVFGSTINPALGRVDYSPLAQGIAQGGMLSAQGIVNLGQGLAQGIQTYVQKQEQKKEEEQATTAIGRILKSNPGLATQLNVPIDEAGDFDRGALRAAIKGAGGPANALKLAATLEELGVQRQARQQQADAARFAQMFDNQGQMFSPLRSDAGAQFSPEARAMGQQMVTQRAQALANLERTRAQTLKDLAPAAADLTAAQRDTEAIISAEIASGALDPKDRKALSKRRSELLALGGRGERQTERYQSPTAIVDANGAYLGQGVFDQKTAEFGLRNPETGKIEPLPKGAKPSTVSGMSRGMLAGPQFLKLREELGQAETALNRLSAYMSSVEDSNQGFQRLADRFSTSIKTLFDTGALKPEELARAAATGQLQSLLGANRIEMLGGGVLTENDALRIIAGLGGDVTALQNKEVVRDAIARMYNDKYRTYQRNRTDYNIQVKGGYGEQGYEQADAVDFDPRFLKASASPQVKEEKRARLGSVLEAIQQLKDRNSKTTTK
jgi:hypothetical protein